MGMESIGGGRIDDPKKARAMAEASNQDRSLAAFARKKLREEIEYLDKMEKRFEEDKSPYLAEHKARLKVAKERTTANFNDAPIDASAELQETEAEKYFDMSEEELGQEGERLTKFFQDLAKQEEDIKDRKIDAEWKIKRLQRAVAERQERKPGEAA